jgi:hypothetical protein
VRPRRKIGEQRTGYLKPLVLDHECNLIVSRKVDMSRSPRSLSPSDESRFVPHSSVVGATSVMDSHFVSSSQAILNNNNNKSHDPVMSRVIIDDEEKSIVGLLGATICFSPVNSPRSSPNMEGVRDDRSYVSSSHLRATISLVV